MPILTTQLIKYTLYGIGDLVNTPGSSAYFRAINSQLGAGNDVNPCVYTFKMEDVVMERVPTIHRITLSAYNLSVVTLTFTLTGVDDTGAVVTATTTKTFGTGVFGAFPAGPIITVFVDLSLTAFRPQLTITRAPGPEAGAFSIVSVLLSGNVEVNQTL
jgi:hypothetical protein